MGYVSPSGLRYFDFEVGTGARPKWGDFLTLNFAMYTIAPDGESLRLAESTFTDRKRTLLVHHGNGRTVLGVEEALHSMRVGGRRRVIVPENLGYVNPGLGPIPSAARKRSKFFEDLRSTGGTAVFDVQIVALAPNDDDPFGYYSDETPSPEELTEILGKAYDENVAKGTPQFEWDETNYVQDPE
jgi:hypothetical protein